MLPLLALLLAASPADDDNPYGRLAPGEVAALVRAGQFGEAGADARIAAWLAAHPNAPKVDRGRLANRLCGDEEMHGAYAAAAQACAQAAASGADDAQDAANNAILRSQPPLVATGSALVPLAPNALGSRQATVVAGGVTAPWVIDSGAQISVVSQSLAKRVGVRLLKTGVGLGSSTGDVTGGLGMIDRLTIGAATIENLPVMVLPDAQLRIAGMPQIEAILGLPAFVAFGRVAWLDHGARFALGAQVPVTPPDAPRLYWHPDGIGVPVTTSRGTMGAHFDSGANVSYLRAPAHALLDPATEATATARHGKMGGAGGVVDTQETVYPNLRLTVAGVPMTLTDIAMEADSPVGAGRLGDDIVRQLSRLTLDFTTMRFEAIR